MRPQWYRSGTQLRLYRARRPRRRLALQRGGDLTRVFIALSLALVVYGMINALAVAKGAWFDRD
jgi:hypothetical protein